MRKSVRALTGGAVLAALVGGPALAAPVDLVCKMTVQTRSDEVGKTGGKAVVRPVADIGLTVDAGPDYVVRRFSADAAMGPLHWRTKATDEVFTRDEVRFCLVGGGCGFRQDNGGGLWGQAELARLNRTNGRITMQVSHGDQSRAYMEVYSGVCAPASPAQVASTD